MEGLHKKIVQGLASISRDLSPQGEEVLHDAHQNITEFSLRQAGLLKVRLALFFSCDPAFGYTPSKSLGRNAGAARYGSFNQSPSLHVQSWL